MKGQRKRPKHAAIGARKLLAANILERMEVRYKNVGDKSTALAEDAGCTLSTVQRATKPDRYNNGVSIDIIDQLAKGLRCEPYELLLPLGQTARP